MTEDASGPLVLYDGDCALCNASVSFIVDRDREGAFRFASLQGTVGRAMLLEHALSTDALDTLVLVEDGRAHVRSTAALRIARRLRSPWSWLWVLALAPRWLRDPPYRFVARHRYRWFGKAHACRLPTPEVRRRFLD